MRYVEFKETIGKELRKNPGGLTWVALRDRLQLPYERPCGSWTRRLEDDIRLIRVKGSGRAYIWKVRKCSPVT